MIFNVCVTWASKMPPFSEKSVLFVEIRIPAGVEIRFPAGVEICIPAGVEIRIPAGVETRTTSIGVTFLCFIADI